MKHRVIFVTRPEMQTLIREMKMEYAPSVEAALAMTDGGSVTVIPNGISVIIRRAAQQDTPHTAPCRAAI